MSCIVVLYVQLCGLTYNFFINRWSSKTNGCGDCYIVMQDNGNLVIYNDDDVAVWASNTCQTGTYMQMPTLQSLDVRNATKHCTVVSTYVLWQT